MNADKVSKNLKDSLLKKFFFKKIRVYPCASVAKICFALLLMAVGPAFSADRPKEDDMFGGDTKASPAATPQDDKSEEGMPALKSHAGAEEALQIGGTLSSEADYYLQDNASLSQDMVTNPNILFLYLDSKLENDARVFARGRLFYDPTGVSGGSPSSFSLTNPYGFGSGNSDNLAISLQELKVSANLDHKVFFTVGRQKVKYGAAKFFNPTDFLNSQAFNFFLPSDERPGVDMVKMHIPSGTANLYAIGLTGNPSSGNPAGGYFRGELGYDGIQDLLGAGEISLSGLFPKNQLGRGGFDISQAVGDLDLYFEGAAGQDPLTTDWKGAYSVGGTYDIRYGDRGGNTISLEAEYFYAGSLAQFGVFTFYLPGPGSWNDITFVETNLYDFLGKTGLSRIDVICQFTTRISGRVYAALDWGPEGGALHAFGQTGQLGTRIDFSF